jgi:signal transduction histidine kinase/CheY-like chemotaxis protein
MSEAPSSVERLSAWRDGMARVYMRGLSFGMPLVILVWLVAHWPPRLDGPLVYLALVWAFFVVMQVVAPRRVQAVALVTMMSLAGIFGAAIFGLSPGPVLAAGSGVILAAATFGRRVGLALLALIFVGNLALGAVASTVGLPTLRADVTDPGQFANWLRLSLFFVVSLGMLLIALTQLFDRMEEAWRATAAAAERERVEHEQRLKAEAERHAVEERSAQAQRLEAIGRLAGGVAHDFNNLLVVIMSWADLLPRVKTDEERREGLDAIRDASAQAAQLTRQLLAYARQDVVNPTAVDVDAFVATTLKSLRRLVPGDVALEHHPSGGARAVVDQGQLGQVVLNLVSNARDAMPRGGTLTLRTRVVRPPDVPVTAPDPSASYLALEVADTGVGMDETTRVHVFEPFFSTKGRARGTGLGLASVQGIVTQAKGWVAVQSSPGAGSTFTVAFPLASQAEAVVSVAAPAATDAPRATRVLLVEDEETVRTAMARGLRAAGFETVEARDVEEALGLARRMREPLDLLCTDGVMPGLPTHVLIDGFRKLFPGAPVLLCSGYVEEELLRRGIEEGSVAVLAKPFTAEALVGKVREVMAAKG